MHLFILILFFVIDLNAQINTTVQQWQSLAADSQQDTNTRIKAYCYLAEGQFYDDIKQYNSYVDAATLLLNDSLSNGMGYISYVKALDAMAKGQLQDALSDIIVAISLARKHKDTDLLISSYLFLSQVYCAKGNTTKSVTNSYKALQLCESLGKASEQSYAYLISSQNYLNLGQIQKAENNFTKVDSVYLLESTKGILPLRQLYVLQKLKLLLKRKKWATARAYQVAYPKNTNLNFSNRLEAEYYYQIGVAYLEQDSISQAQTYLKSAEKNVGALQATAMQVAIITHYGYIAIQKKQFKNAQLLLEKALLMVRGNRSMLLLKRVYRLLAELNTLMANYKDAMMYYRRYTTVKDSIFTLDKNRAIAEIEIKHKTGLLTKEKEEQAEKIKNQQLAIEISKLKNSQNSYIIIGLIAGLLLLLIIGLLVFRQGTLKTQIRETELEQRALRSQMNPHFMFNSLNSIQSLIATDKNAEASIYLAKFARLMRRILQNSREAYIPLSQEIEFLDNYIELEQKRFKEAFDYSLDDSEVEDSHFVMIPPLVIQPFIENAIIHGLLRKSDKGTLHVSFSEYNQHLVKCCIEDDGIGREAAAVFKTDKQQESLGVKITEQRLKYLTIKDKINEPFIQFVDLKDENGTASGTKVELLLPIKYKV